MEGQRNWSNSCAKKDEHCCNDQHKVRMPKAFFSKAYYNMQLLSLLCCSIDSMKNGLPIKLNTGIASRQKQVGASHDCVSNWRAVQYTGIGYQRGVCITESFLCDIRCRERFDI